MKIIIFLIFLLSIQTAQAEEVTIGFDRVMKTNKLRCGYAIATPWFMKDPLSGNLSGYGYDVTMALASKAGLEVEWVEETG